MVVGPLFLVLLVLCDQTLGQDHGVVISYPAASIGHYLNSLPRRELGEAQLQDLISDEKLIEDKEDLQGNLDLACQRLENKLTILKHHLSNLSTEFSASRTPSKEFSPPPPCCSSHLNTEVNKGCSVIHYGPMGTEAATLAGQVFQELSVPKGCTRRFYISADKSAHVEFPAARACSQQAFNWHLETVTETLNPERKKAIILLDRGHSLSTLQLDVGRAIAGLVLESLNEKDSVALITLDERMNFVDGQNCLKKSFAKATSATKKTFQSHLNAFNRMPTYSHHDHVQGLREAEQLIAEDKSGTVHLFFISSISAIKSPSQWVHAYEKMSDKYSNVVLHIYFMDKEGDLSSLKYFKDTVAKWKGGGRKADLAIVDSTLLLSLNLGNFFNSSKPSCCKAEPLLSSPKINDKDGSPEVIFSLAAPIIIGQSTEAIVGLDISYNFLMEDVAFDNNADSLTYSVIDKSSKSVVYHPKLYTGHEEDFKLFPQGIRLTALDHSIEPSTEEQILIEASGQLSSPRKLILWKHVQNTDLVVVLFRNNRKSVKRLSVPNIGMSPALAVYHRLDLLPESYQGKLCRHMHLPATLEAGSVFLSPTAFANPFDHIHSNLTREEADEVMRYLTSNNSYNSVRPGIKEDVLLLAEALTTWKNMSFSSGMNNYIVRRFSATSKGVLFSYPGSPMLESTDPTAQDWYLTAHQFEHRVVVNRPRLDIGGAGYVVTVSKFISGNDDQNAMSLVLGMDLTMGYLYNMLLDTLPICNNMENVRCFLFDHEGYLIVHPSQFDADEDAKVEGLHLSQVEHLAVKLMTRDKSLVERKKCKRFSDMTLQSYYEFNTTLSISHLSQSHMWTNLHNEDSCLSYQVALLPGTNLFLGLVLSNSTCSKKEDTTFCPCSVRGRLCILCQEEPLSCECPCECPLRQCPLEEALPLCPQQPQSLKPGPSTDHPSQLLSDLALPPCFDPDCSRHSNKDTCFGVIGCSWCAFERKEGQLSMIDQPFCSEQSKCFAGILGAASPYEKLERGSRRIMEDEDGFFRPTPSIGPIAGSIVSAILFLGLSAYCIRNYNKCVCTRSPENNRRLRHGSSLQVANFEEVVEDTTDEELRELGTMKNAVAHQEAIISPYRMNPGYRRPPPGTDSDHGYSTMTPIGDLDSEIVPYLESASARNRIQRMHQRNGAPSSIQSITSSSRTSSPIPTAASVAIAAASIQRNNETFESTVVRGATRQVSNEGAALLSSTTDPLHPLDPETMLPIANKNQFLVSVTVHHASS